MMDFSDITLPASVASAAGMLSQGERRMLYSLARDHYRGEGEIIDGGSFFGSSAASIAQGLRDNPHFEPREVIHAYELGYLPAPKRGDRARKFGNQEYTMGESFVPILENTIEPWADLIELNIGDLNEKEWTGQQIDICFIDVCKTAQLNAHVAKQFYSHIPVGGYLINQDFFFDRLPWIKVTMGYLSEYFEWKGRVFSSSIWECIKPVPQEVADFDPWSDPKDYHNAAYYDGLGEDALFMLDISSAYLTAYNGDSEAALASLDVIERDYSAHIEKMKNRDKKGRDALFRINRARTQIRNGVVVRSA